MPAAPGGGDAPAREPGLLSVEGRTWPVALHYLQEPCADYVRAAVETALEINAAEGPGDILIFLTGQEEACTPPPPPQLCQMCGDATRTFRGGVS